MEDSRESSTPTPRNKHHSLGLKKSLAKIKKTPLSDVKVNYNSLRENLSSNTTSPSTPCGPQSLELKMTASTSHCRPYCLSLSRRVRERYKKKRLEFTAQETETSSVPKSATTSDHVLCIDQSGKAGRLQAADNPTEVTVLGDSNISTHQNASTISDDEEYLIKELTAKEDLLKSHQKHQEAVRELQATINKWKTAFQDSLSELSAKAEPKMEIEDLLAHLGIAPEMINYIDT